MHIGFSEFVKICNVEDRRHYGGFRVETDGLYVIVPDADTPLSSDELSVLSWHPTGNHNEPALRLPCTPEQLHAFVADAGLLGCIDELKLDAILLEQAPTAEQPETKAAVAKQVEVPRSITKGRVASAFQDIHLSADAWAKALADGPKWLIPCRVSKGLRGNNDVPSTWNPVLIAAALLDKGIDIEKLDPVFVGLNDWADEWREKSAYFRG